MRDNTSADTNFSSDGHVDISMGERSAPRASTTDGARTFDASVERGVATRSALPMLREDACDRDSLRALLLAIYRTPARFPFWLDAETPLPPGIGVLLREALEVGNTSSVLGQGFPSPLPESAGQDELIQAALFFVLHVMITPGANHYRVMGLDPMASLREITERYQLLRRLLAVQEAWPAVREGVERISRAYVVLRDRASRDAYDRSLLRGG